MDRQISFPGVWIAAAAFSLVLSQQNRLHAQTLETFRVGDTPTRLSKFGPVSGLEKYGQMDVFKWRLAKGNLFTAMVDANGEIEYLESDWGGKGEDTGCDLAGLRFGVTTLADLRKRFGSNGFGYKGRPHVRQNEDGVVLLNSYEVENVVITFYTRISAPDYAKIQASDGKESGEEYAKLDGISLANAAYAKLEWGNRVANPAYKKIEWK
jgi:hypothetical protein